MHRGHHAENYEAILLEKCRHCSHALVLLQKLDIPSFLISKCTLRVAAELSCVCMSQCVVWLLSVLMSQSWALYELIFAELLYIRKHFSMWRATLKQT